MARENLAPCACGCGQLFEPFDNRGRPRRFIYGHQGRNQPHKRQTVICEHCGKEVERPQWHMKRVKHHFCSRECDGAWSSRTGRRRGANNGAYNTITRPCAGCGAAVSKPASLINRRNGRVYCPTCIPAYRRGQRSAYVGYPKEFDSRLRKRVRQRDKFTCRECGAHQRDTGTLHVHHIDYDKTNNELHNLISLCSKCHGLTQFALDAWREKFTRMMLSS